MSKRWRGSAVAWLLAAYAAFGLGIVVLVALDVNVLDLFSDPGELSDTLGDHPWKASAAMVGVFAWAGTAAVGLFAGALLRSAEGPGPASSFLLATGALALLFALDDALAIHDGFAPLLIDSDLAEVPVLLVLLALAIVWAVRFRREILASRYPLLALAAAGLGGAFLLDLDQKLGVGFRGRGLIEESIEFAGVWTLFLYACSVAWDALLQAGLGATARERY